MAFIFVINMHAVVAGIRTWDFLRHVHLSYHLTYTSLVMWTEIFSFWSNPWMSLRYRLATPTGTLRALGTGWCYQQVPKAHPRVTSKGKYLSFHHKWCVGDMVRKVHVTQEVRSSNPSHHRMHIFDKNECHWYRLRYPVLKLPVEKTGT